MEIFFLYVDCPEQSSEEFPQLFQYCDQILGAMQQNTAANQISLMYLGTCSNYVRTTVKPAIHQKHSNVDVCFHHLTVEAGL